MRICFVLICERHYPEIFGGGKEIRFFIDDFPVRPEAGDCIDDTVIDKMGLSEDAVEAISALAFSVDEGMVFRKDNKGIYLEIYCSGE